MNPHPSVSEEPNDAAIIDGLHRGDRAAWSGLYDRYGERIWRFVARLTGNDQSVVGDLVQETFLATARSARQFDASRGTLWSWMAGIAHHHVAHHWRQTARQQQVLASMETVDTLGRCWEQLDDDPSAGLLTAETIDLVRLVLSRLPADYAGLLTAKYLDDLSLTELQQLFGGHPDAIRSRLHRARVEFRAEYERLSSPPGEVRADSSLKRY